jgi:iron-sulfur cluster repair protein YtfE (RIC family)
MGESILVKLREGHQTIKDLINQTEKATDVVQKKELYLQVKDEMISHMDGEEKTIYRHLIEDVGNEESEEVAHDAEDEHEEMRNLCEKLDNIHIESKDWESTFHRLKKHFLDHIQKEESALFAEAREDFSKEELMDFGEEYENAKGQGHP